MPEYINKQQLLKKAKAHQGSPFGVPLIIEEIEKAEGAEVKCRCKDCKHYRRYGRTSLLFEGKNIQCGWCVLRAKADEEHRMLPFDFCSYGERKTE